MLITHSVGYFLGLFIPFCQTTKLPLMSPDAVISSNLHVAMSAIGNLCSCDHKKIFNELIRTHFS